MWSILSSYLSATALKTDPVWLLVVGASSGAKTEMLRSLEGLSNVRMVSAISSESAFLSGTAKDERAAGAKGGLLNELPRSGGVLLLKDLTTLFSMRHEKKVEVFAALREIHDGSWSRTLGVEGGRTFNWRGRLGVIAACTTEADTLHNAVAAQGLRFVQVRIVPEPDTAADSALALEGHHEEKRKILHETVVTLLEDPPGEIGNKNAVASQVKALAKFTTLARSAVDRNYRGEIELVHDPESPPRFLAALLHLWQSASLIGLPPSESSEIIRRVAFDSIPKLRRMILGTMAASRVSMQTSQIVSGVKHPRMAVLRTLEDLHAHGVVDRIGASQGESHSWRLSGTVFDWLKEAEVIADEE